MSQTAITLAFEQHLADLQMGGQPVIPDEFVLAHVPGLNLTAPIDRAAGLPPAGQIVHRQPVDQRGKVNANGVAYSIIMDTRIGDFTFNAMYLVHKASGLVAMVVHKAAEDKLKNQTNRPGNSLVKSMLMEYQGAAEATNTQVDAGTWQIDFSARLLGLDRDIQQQAHDHYGDAAFIADGFSVRPGQGVNEFMVAAGLGYIAGLRTELTAEQSITVNQRPTTLYADVYHAGTLLSDWHTHIEIKVSSTPLTDYTDEAGYPHYVTPLAQLAANGAVTDLRGRGGLWWHEQRPQAHTKEQVGLDKLENWSWSHSYTDATGGAARYASGKAVADAYNELNSAKLNKSGGMMTGHIHRDITGNGGEFRHLTTPNGAFMFAGGSSVGAVKITLPTNGNNTMLRMRVSLFEYDTNETTDILITGYNHSGGWQRVGALVMGEKVERDFPIRFGRSNTNDLIYIGNVDTVWSYPKIHVSDVSLTHSGSDQAVWDNPWSIDLETVAFEGVTETLYDNLPAGDWNKLKNRPSTFPPDSHAHSWVSITGKPTNYTPSSHSHSWSEISGKPEQSTRWPGWDEVTDKPELFTPTGEAFADGSGWAIIGSITTSEGIKPLIKQWGVDAGITSNAGMLHDFPISFPNKALSIVSVGNSSDAAEFEITEARIVNKAQFAMVNSASKTSNWEAIGY